MAASADVCVVTGASRGIGAEIAREAARRGWSVAVNHRASADAAKAVVAGIRAAGGNAADFAADVTDHAACEAMMAAVTRELGPIRGLVNNAGITGSTGRVDELDADASRRLFEVNILGPFNAAGAAIRRMAQRHGGTGGAIVNIGSAAARHGGPGSYIDYAASKAAIDTFTIGLSREVAADGIRVNCLRPGVTMTEMNIDWMKSNPDYEARVLAQVPMGRAAQEAEIARAALFLLSDEASYVTGAILDASGGWVNP